MSPSRTMSIRHEFVEFIPDNLDNGVLYISIPHRTALHRCLCGCGYEVATPLAPHEWKLTFDGQSVSLYPSIGNWGLSCQSHYWIRDGRVIWSKRLPAHRIEKLRAREREEYERQHSASVRQDEDSCIERPGLLGRLWGTLRHE